MLLVYWSICLSEKKNCKQRGVIPFTHYYIGNVVHSVCICCMLITHIIGVSWYRRNNFHYFHKIGTFIQCKWVTKIFIFYFFQFFNISVQCQVLCDCWFVRFVSFTFTLLLHLKELLFIGWSQGKESKFIIHWRYAVGRVGKKSQFLQILFKFKKIICVEYKVTVTVLHLMLIAHTLDDLVISSLYVLL